MPKTTSWNIGIQILRGIAAMLVVSHHSLEESLAISTKIAPEWLIRIGASGVDIFFVISGFIIYSVTYGREPRNPEQALVLWLSGYFYRSLHLDAQILGCSFLLLPSSKLIIGVAWTLVYEMYFYYLFSLTLWLRNARIAILTTTCLIGTGLVLSNLLPEGDIKHFLSNPIALEFCFGLVLSYFIHNQVLSGVWLRYMWVPGLILMVAAAVFAENTYSNTAGPAQDVRYLEWGLPALLVAVSFIKMRFDKSLLTRILVPIGDASYSIYLTHPTMMILFATLVKYHVLKPIPYPIILPLLLVVISVVFGLLIHYSIERPVLAWFRGSLHAQDRFRRFAVAFRGFVGINRNSPAPASKLGVTATSSEESRFTATRDRS
jgi:exopolysaccharide production protein ExoZ